MQKVSIANDVFERVEEEALKKVEDALNKGMFEEAENMGVLTLIKGGIMTQLNLMGRVIWDNFKTPITIEEVAKKISGEYKIDYDKCLIDIRDFVKDLISKGFLVYA